MLVSAEAWRMHSGEDTAILEVNVDPKITKELQF